MSCPNPPGVSDRALWAVTGTAHISGTSTGKTGDAFVALGSHTEGSKSSVSRIRENIDALSPCSPNRDPGYTQFVYLQLDATYVHAPHLGQLTTPGPW